MRRFLILALGCWGLSFSYPAMADPVPGPVRSAVFLEAVATRGVECDLMRPWQASALRAQNLKDMERWSPERRLIFADEIERALSERSCDDEGIGVWINGASRGFDSEILPPYLIVYRTLVSYETPPAIFSSTTARLRYGPAVEAINQKLSALEASGAKAEGGKPWPEYIERIETAARGFVSTLANEDAPLAERDEAAVWIAQTAHIVELWLLDEGK